MKRTQKFFALFAAMFVAASADATSKASPFFTIRSQGENLAREQVGWEDQINLFDMESIYGAFYIAPYYSQTFKDKDIAHCIFGDDVDCSDCGGVLKIQGSCVANRDKKAWLADYFGLASNYDGTITFRPRIRNFVVDLGFYLGLDEVASGLWLQVNLPITHTRWNLRYTEDRKAPSSSVAAASHPVGYFSSTDVEAANLVKNAVDFFTGNATPTIENCDGSTVKFNALDCCKWAQECGGCDGKDSGDLTKTRPADVELILGWNFLRDEDYHMGLGIRFTAPTGNTPKGEYLFEPIVGTGGNWTLGARFTTHAIMWRSEDEERSFGFYLDANISHLFKECQTRCFDLCGKPNSRYALAMKLADNGDTALQGNPTATATDSLTNSTKVFADEFSPVANLTKSNVDVSASVQGDVAFKFAYVSGGFSWDLGYNFYGRACEDLYRKSGCNDEDLTKWALKGDSQVYGFLAVTSVDACESARALAATQSASDIHKGVSRTEATCTSTVNVNANVDNAQFALSNGTALNYGPLLLDPANQTRTSIQPINLTVDQLDLTGTKIISHKIYTNISYAWIDHEDWTPFLGVGAEVEFNGNGCGDCDDDCNTNSCTTSSSSSSSCNKSCDNDCDDCNKCGANSWGVWVKGGIAFN